MASFVPAALAGGVSERSGHVNDPGLMTLANQMQLFMEPELAFYYSPQFQWGISQDLEAMLILGARFGDEISTDAGLAAVRLELADGFALSLGATFPVKGDGTYLGIYSGAYGTLTLSEGLTYTANVALNVTPANTDSSWFWHTSVVEYSFNSDWSAYLEADWVIPISKSLGDSDLNVFVGAQYNLNKTHALNAFVTIPFLPSVAPENVSVGLTWALAWNI
jgi:hypothetical protein